MKQSITNLVNRDFQFDRNKKLLSAEEYSQVVKAADIMTQAREKAEQIVAAAEDIYQKEKERGYDEGLAQSKLDQAEQMMNMVGNSINYLAEMELKLAKIVMSAVKKIIAAFNNDDMTLNLIHTALVHVRNEQQVTVRIAPAQFGYVQSHIEELLSSYKGIGFINPVSDVRLREGDCIIESQLGVVDASVEVQLKALQQCFDRLSPASIGAKVNEELGE